jgi:hypothetical protein
LGSTSDRQDSLASRSARRPDDLNGHIALPGIADCVGGPAQAPRRLTVPHGYHDAGAVHHGSAASVPKAVPKTEPTRRTCTVPDCDRPHYGRGWCRRHYVRVLRHGSPDVVRQGGRGRISSRSAPPDLSMDALLPIAGLSDPPFAWFNDLTAAGQHYARRLWAEAERSLDHDDSRWKTVTAGAMNWGRQER